jgi:hypothetical protein
MLQVREIKLLVEKIGQIFHGKEGAICGGALGQLVARYLAHFPQEAQPGVIDLFEKMVAATVRDLNSGLDRLSMESFVHVPQETIEAMEEDPELAAEINAGMELVKLAMGKFVAGEFETVEEALESVGVEGRIVAADEIPEIEEKIASRRNRMN